MHMADAMLSPAVGATMYGLSGIAAAYSIHKLNKEEDLIKKIPTMGVMGAFVFATQIFADGGLLALGGNVGGFN